ncbi:MAG: four helix bundle protein [Bacteroidota bacterium]
MYTYSFEKLEAWKLSMNLTTHIYLITKEFPKIEQFGITDQIRRSAISINSNIAEGTGRNTGKDKAHFTTIAYSSMLELLNQLIIAHELHYLTHDQLATCRNLIDGVGIRLTGLRKSQLNAVSKPL